MTATITASEAFRQPRRWPLRWLAAAASGVLLCLAFAPVHATLLVFVGMVPLYWAAYSPPGPGELPLGFRRQFLIGFLASLVFFALLLHWILYLSNQEVTIPGIMIPSLLFMSAYLAVFFGMAVALAGWCERTSGVSPAITLPIFWTLLDRAREAGVLGFPWGSLGYSLATHATALQVTAWAGFWALTFWIVLVNGLVSAALQYWQERRFAAVWQRGGAAVLLILVPYLFGWWVLSRAPAVSGDAPAGLRMALLQPNTPREIKWKEGFEGLVVNDLLSRTEQAAALQPDLIVWPETAAPVLILWVPDLAARLHSTFVSLRKWVLVGTLDSVLHPGGRVQDYNAAILFDPGGFPLARYYKEHLVPFSEAMPFQKEIPWINALNFGQSDFSQGREKNLFQVEGYRFSCLICFESIFPEMSRQAVQGGAQYLINITNDFWFGRSAGPVQHAEMAVCRAVENRTPLARCANSGISFFVDPYGRVFDRTGLFEEKIITARQVPGRGGSFYTRHGEWFSWALLILGVLSLGQAVWTEVGLRRAIRAGR